VWLPGALVESVAGRRPHWPARVGDAANALRCPQDAQALQVVKAGTIELDWCARCHGVWLDQGELAAIATRQAPGQPPRQKSREQDAHPLEELTADGVDAGIDVAGDWIGRVGRRLPRSGKSGADALEVASAAKPPPLPVVVPASLDAEGQPFAVELDATSTADAAGAAADAGSGLLDATGEVAGQLIEGALSLIGDVFSAL
jgi:Zn-finger nucleic acid-binding protein